MWIESHTTLRGHPKLEALADLLGISEPQAVGHLHYLWWWCLDYADDGDLTRKSARTIARGAQWTGDPQAFIEALLNCGDECEAGFLERTEDGRILVHDWEDYAGKIINRRAANARRKAEARKAQAPTAAPVPPDGGEVSQGRHADVTGTSRGRAEDVSRTSGATGPTDMTDMTDMTGHDRPTKARAESRATAAESTQTIDLPADVAHLLHLVGAKRFKTRAQCAAYCELSREVGSERFREVCEWAARRGLGLRDFESIATAARKPRPTKPTPKGRDYFDNITAYNQAADAKPGDSTGGHISELYD